MLENAYHFKYFQNNNPILKSRDGTNPTDLPTLKAYPFNGEGGRFAKMRGKDELKGTRRKFTLWLRVFEHRCDLGVLQTS